MPRKRPHTLRRVRSPKTCWHDVPHVPGLDKRSQHEISGIEWRTARDWARYGFWPGAIGAALSGWREVARRPRTRLFLPCGCCGRHPRALLQEALDALGAETAECVRNLVSPLDEEFHRRTVPDPHLPDNLPWWERRCPL